MKDSFGLFAGGDPAPVSLKSQHWKGILDGLLFTYTQTLVYRNIQNEPLEISYRFPMSWNTVLTDFSAEVNGVVLNARPISTKVTEFKNKKAPEADGMPLMLKCSDDSDGVCTADLGSLKPGEEVKLMLSFAKVVRFEHGNVSISIPANTEGCSSNGREEEFLSLRTDDDVSAVHYPASAEFEIRGPAADAAVTCPDHYAKFSKKEGALYASILCVAPYRDITLLCEGVAPFADAKFARKADGTVASLVTSVYKPDVVSQTGSLRLRILVDGSGSMEGAPIFQAKTAVLNVLGKLKDGDEITFSYFGESCISKSFPM
jgi:Ca-activated chloride channel family protein